MTRENLLKSASARILGVINDPTFGNQWAQVRSKHLLKSISPEEVGAINYTYSVQRLIRNATAVLQTALLLSENNSDELIGYCWRTLSSPISTPQSHFVWVNEPCRRH